MDCFYQLIIQIYVELDILTNQGLMGLGDCISMIRSHKNKRNDAVDIKRREFFRKLGSTSAALAAGAVAPAMVYTDIRFTGTKTH